MLTAQPNFTKSQSEQHELQKNARIKVATRSAEIELDRIDAILKMVSKKYPDMEDNLIVQITLRVHASGEN